jgi:uncharacterized membrane protein
LDLLHHRLQRTLGPMASATMIITTRIDVMHHANGWMTGVSGGGMWIWTIVGVLLVVVLVIVIRKISKK